MSVCFTFLRKRDWMVGDPFAHRPERGEREPDMAFADERGRRVREGLPCRPVLVCESNESASLELGDDTGRQSPHGQEPDAEEGPVPDEVPGPQIPGRDLAAVTRGDVSCLLYTSDAAD